MNACMAVIGNILCAYYLIVPYNYATCQWPVIALSYNIYLYYISSDAVYIATVAAHVNYCQYIFVIIKRLLWHSFIFVESASTNCDN